MSLSSSPKDPRDETIIFIGPEGSGKSTIGKIIAPILDSELYSLDRHRDELYAPYDYDKDLAAKIYKEQGLWPFYEYWKGFEYQAVSHILQNAAIPGQPFHGKILDFGAGHSVYEDPVQHSHIEGLLKPYRSVFLILPCKDVEEAIKITEGRRGHELGLNRHFLEHESNRKLAKYTIYTHSSSPEECAEKILAIIRRQ